ncbi:MAG: methyltransferase domain-containing protein [Sphingomonadales bacterium]|jgi:SAM-dependent methyltransferase
MTDPVILFDRKQVGRARERALKMDPDGDFLRLEIWDRIQDRLLEVSRQFQNILIIGAPGSVSFPDAHVVEAHSLHRRGTSRLVLDEEILPFKDDSFDLIISLLDLHWVNDLPGALIQFNRALKADGLFMAALFSSGTLAELKSCLLEAEAALDHGTSPHIAPFADVRDLGGLLQRAGFAMPVADQDKISIRYQSAFHLMQDLRKMGESNALVTRHKGLSSRSVFFTAAESYAQAYSGDDGRVSAQFNISFLTGWAPAPGQPRPKRPGSAKVRLADALNTREQKL